MLSAFDSVRVLLARQDRRTLLLILTILILALFVLAAGAPCLHPPP
jgi:hypothetical protein